MKRNLKLMLVAVAAMLFVFCVAGPIQASGINVNVHMYTGPDSLVDDSTSTASWTCVGTDYDTTDAIDMREYDKLAVQWTFASTDADADSLSIGFYLQASVDDTLYTTIDSLAAFTSLPSDSTAYKVFTNIVASSVRIITQGFAANEKAAGDNTGWAVEGKYRKMQ